MCIRDRSDREFTREGIDIRSELTVSYLQAILGCSIEVDTVDSKKPDEKETDGKELLNIPTGTQPNTILILDNKGVPKLGNPVSRGNHLITIRVNIPNKISSEERELLEKLATVRGETIGKGSKEGFLGGLFQK